jgi:hypothetical protein
MMEDGPFTLRKAIVDPAGKNCVNKHIAPFIGVGRVHVHMMTDSSSIVNEDVLYQIYPGDKSKTYYTLPPQHIMFIYCVLVVGQEMKLVAQNDAHDNYAYFKLPNGTFAIVVACAKTQQEAEGWIAADFTK